MTPNFPPTPFMHSRPAAWCSLIGPAISDNLCGSWTFVANLATLSFHPRSLWCRAPSPASSASSLMLSNIVCFIPPPLNLLAGNLHPSSLSHPVSSGGFACMPWPINYALFILFTAAFSKEDRLFSYLLQISACPWITQTKKVACLCDDRVTLTKRLKEMVLCLSALHLGVWPSLAMMYVGVRAETVSLCLP